MKQKSILLSLWLLKSPVKGLNFRTPGFGVRAVRGFGAVGGGGLGVKR